MWRVLVILALVPLAVALLARQVWWGRVARREVGVVAGAPPANELAVELAGGHGATVRVVKGIMPAVCGGRVVLPRGRWAGRDAASLGLAVQAAGWCLWARREPEAAAARLRVLRFGAVVPGLAVLVAVFAILAAKLAAVWALTGVLVVAALAAVMQLTSIAAELRAAATGIGALRASRVALRAADLERIEACAKAAAWRSALPLSLAWITGGSGQGVEKEREPGDDA